MNSDFIRPQMRFTSRIEFEAANFRNGSWLCRSVGLDPAWSVVLRIGAVVWTIAGFRLVTGPVTTRERSKRVLSEVIGDRERGIYALIASISGSMPKMFMTRVRL